ncbi:MAG: LLM class F420-dependent oxidoreductase [Candidatus Rokubacteria bacterium]|nr:LLM class F420-dependent oxidoreductase [Candidatus Rokubacteria bacterium]MBI2017083.1 LLM class F420-dependent oxidoreductase [Candidatus Rokubacteria bacterium]
MEFGCHLPVYGPAATRDTLLGFARRMEALGYDSLWASDHVVIPHEIRSRYPYSPTGDFPLAMTATFLEPLMALGLVAGVTERVRLGTSVLVLPHRHPVLAAKMFATLDHLAPGRVIVGAGVGWMREEIEIFGVPYERRGAWSDEALRVMRACWAGERVEHRGEFFRFPAVAALPRPARGTIPVWIGGHTARAFRRVVELGDGWHAAFASAGKMQAGMADLEAACRKAGRDPKSLTISARIGLPARQDAAALVAEIRALAALGVSHIILESRIRDLDDLTAIYERFANDVRAKL